MILIDDFRSLFYFYSILMCFKNVSENSSFSFTTIVEESIGIALYAVRTGNMESVLVAFFERERLYRGYIKPTENVCMDAT